MINVIQKQILQLAVRAGKLMMQSGAEIYRVEETVTRICNAYGIPNVEVFAIPTGIIVSLDSGDANSEVLSHVIRIRSTGTDLKRISDLNALSRKFTTTRMTRAEGLRTLDRISQEKTYPVPAQLAGAALVAFFFCALRSGDLMDSICAGIIGVASFSLSLLLQRYLVNYFIRGFLCCALATILALLSVRLSIGDSVNAIVIGSMMLYVPGAAITNSMRDFLRGDTLAGVARMAEALVIAASLATGAGLVLKLWSARALSLSASLPNENIAISMMLGFLATFGFTILFHVPKRSMFLSSIAGGCSWVVVGLLQSTGSIAAGFLAACVVGLLSEIFARIFHEAATVYIIPGIMPLVPGSRIYYTMLELVHGDVGNAVNMGAEALFLAGAIAIGLLSVSGIFRMLSAAIRAIRSHSAG